MLPSEIFYRISHGVCVRWRLHQNIQASHLPYVIHVFRADLLGTVCHLIQHQILEIGVGIWHLTSALSAETNVFFPVVGLKGLWGWLPPKHTVSKVRWEWIQPTRLRKYIRGRTEWENWKRTENYASKNSSQGSQENMFMWKISYKLIQ